MPPAPRRGRKTAGYVPTSVRYRTFVGAPEICWHDNTSEVFPHNFPCAVVIQANGRKSGMQRLD
jgi:hypothetical protein